MLNIGFSELLIIGAVGLIVIGPQRLPQTARFLGHFFGRVQRQVASVKADIKREMALEDMKKIHQEYEQTANQVRDAFADTAKQVRDAENDIMAKAVAMGKDDDGKGNGEDALLVTKASAKESSVENSSAEVLPPVKEKTPAPPSVGDVTDDGDKST